MLLLSLKDFNDAVKFHVVKSVLNELFRKKNFHIQRKLTKFHFECNSISGTGSGNKDFPSLPNPNYLISQ